MIQKQLGKQLVDVKDIAKSTKEDIDNYDLLLLGIPTWYYGEAQCDWDDFFPELEQIDFSDKIVAIFGCGDQEDYAEYFLDAMGMVGDIVMAKGGTIIGHTSTEGYDFEASKAEIEEGVFIGLGIDEDRQPELTNERVTSWCKQIHEEMCLSELS
jgi:flavodoxin I